MSRRLVLVWAIALFALEGSQARAQIPFPHDLLPKREALARLGLEKHWMAVIPLVGDERMISLSLSKDLVFARTNKGFLHTYNAETGKLLWTARLGTMTASPMPGSVNSFGVYVTNLGFLHALDRKTGRAFWVQDLGTLASSATACDEERAMVGLANGKIYAYNLFEKNVREGTSKIADKPLEAWNWQTAGVVKTRPLPAGKVVAFAATDGKVYVSLADERTMLYRIATGGAIADGLGTHGTRLLLAPSADRNFYGIDLLTAKVLWSFPSGAAIDQAPLVAGDDIFMANTAGSLFSIDPKGGTSKWTTSTLGGRLLAVGEKRIYLESHDDDLFIVDRASGQLVVTPHATFSRIGLNLREYQHAPTNYENDRLYFATNSGMVIAIRETGATEPRMLRDPKGLPFGYIPPEGIPTTPAPVTPPAELPPPPGQTADTPK